MGSSSATIGVASPLSVLRLVAGQYYQFARRYPMRYRLLLEESRQDRVVGREARQVLTTVADVVKDAQRSGELLDGDPEQIAALIFGAVHGMADLEQFGLVKVEAEMIALPVEILSRQLFQP